MLEAKITDANGKNIADIDVDMSELSDNQPYDIKLPEKIKTDNNESYTLELICKSLDGDSQISFTMEILSRWQKERYPNHMMIALACM